VPLAASRWLETISFLYINHRPGGQLVNSPTTPSPERWWQLPFGIPIIKSEVSNSNSFISFQPDSILPIAKYW